MRDFTYQTQAYSTWGDKLLQHCDRLHEIQSQRRFRPITIQLAPTEVCESHCPFCSVENRPAGKIPFSHIVKGVGQFVELGAKAVEITGGGNPCLYRDASKDINNIIQLCGDYGLEVGLITNTHRLGDRLTPESVNRCRWIRVSLAKLDEGKVASDYDLSIAKAKLGLSYIVHHGTDPRVFGEIKRLLDAYPETKFVRIAPDCLTDDSLVFKEKWEALVSDLDPRCFIKDIGGNYHAFAGGCWVGMIRPYWTSTGVYICTSHVLKERRYLPEYRLCGAEDIAESWERMNDRFENGLPPYEIDVTKCWHCYYNPSNSVLSAVINELPDRNFA